MALRCDFEIVRRTDLVLQNEGAHQMTSHSIRLAALTIAVSFLILTVGTGCDQSLQASPRNAQKAEAAAQQARVEHGKYLVTLMGCNDCHTPLKMGANGPEPDMTRMLSGHPSQFKLTSRPKIDNTWAWAGAGTNTAFYGPWGTTYAANLTPDRNTGLGIWTEDLFIKALRTGKHWGTARPIMPPMPWQGFGKATDEDLKSIYAFLRTIKPIDNQVPEYEPPAAMAQAAPSVAAAKGKK
jgi:hypothetical protein